MVTRRTVLRSAAAAAVAGSAVGAGYGTAQADTTVTVDPAADHGTWAG